MSEYPEFSPDDTKRIGDQIGVDWDKYPLEEFRTQLAAVRTFSDGYCWIYGHGSSWWQLSADQADRYAQEVHRFPRENYLVPTVANIDEYYRVAAQKNVVTWEVAQQ